MAIVKLYNSLTKQIQDFIPLKNDEVSIYTCGPTLYNTPHIGNYRAYVFADILRRTLESFEYNVKQVINLTDVDDKTIKKSISLDLSLSELTHQYEQDFHKGRKDLYLLDAYKGRKDLYLLDAYKYPRATESINMMVEIIKTLLDKGYAYKDNDNSIYFKVGQDKEYGKLVNIDKDKLKQNASGRMSSDEYDNDSVQDFALWKAWDADDGNVFWDTELGKGRPGWHIECSAMAKEFLGETIDIHTGGVDNMFPHHENEIAQSECAHGKVFSNYFLHCEHLLVDGKKMAKRDGNFLMLTDLVQNGVSPLSYKYFLYGTHYRTPANLTWDGLFAAQTSLMRMYEKFISIINVKVGTAETIYVDKVKSALQNDLNTAESLANFIVLFDDASIAPENKLATVLAVDTILGLGFNEYYKLDKTLPSDAQTIAEERFNARSLKDYTRSDELRELLNQRGYIVIDTKDSSIVVTNPLK